MVSRFTIDSATEFLFGSDIRTLSAGLPYPASSPLADSAAFLNHPSNKFASAFVAGQYASVRRTGYGHNWPLVEFWKDEVKASRKVVDQFIEPVLVEALAKRAQGTVESKTFPDGEKANSEEDTLLNYLISQTQGFSDLLYSHVLNSYPPSDIQLLKDEVML